MSREKPANDPVSSLIPTVKDPFKSQSYVDPLKKLAGEYKDPLKVPKGEYKDPVKSIQVKIPEYKPYTSYHEYEMPDIDPVTGKPRVKRSPRQKREEEAPKKGKHPLGKSLFPAQLGSSVGSMKRTLRIQENLNF
ncbi:uncharacterized protein LOC132748296 [Ruditapes philippinarum]|uniref:uncharacterized protein LOC132748296 n=1 Tax=Ruditapes philippinarum TaxID=129788 RepID=UPI00295B404C|nr:uncharacterized protein LOC132748296 [Ruditapes philippinarum]XP_060593851.1 uncharacterized protein LOC132748296 [Ruditapes philippinarum]